MKVSIHSPGLIFFFLFCNLLTPAAAQNLVPNPSFEIYDDCPTGASQVSAPIYTPGTVQDWFNPIGSSSDYFNACAPTGWWASFPVNVPSNWGYQMARTGEAYVGGYAVYRPSDEFLPTYAEYAEYVEAPLLTPLVAGHHYYVGYWIALSHDNVNSLIACDQMGAYFQEGYYYDPSSVNRIPVTPQVVSPEGRIYTDTANWQLVSGTFTAEGGEDWVILGNFSPFDSLNLLKIYYLPFFETIGQLISYYYIDDVCVLDLDGPPIGNSLRQIKICEGDSLTIRGREGFQYVWENGSNGSSRNIKAEGLYWVKSIDTAACGGFYLDSFEVIVGKTELDLDIGSDTVLCPGETITLDAGREELDVYLWNTGATESSIIVSEPGRYYVNAWGDCYFSMDTIIISRFRESWLAAIDDTIICAGDEIQLRYQSPEFDYRWSTGETGCCIDATEAGTYIIEAIDKCGNRLFDTVSVLATACQDCFLVPNAFTPNSDGVNDQFKPLSQCLFGSYRMSIYDRWGQRIFISYRPEDGWDGTIQGRPADVGVYYYEIIGQPVIDRAPQSYVKGDITLLR